MRLEVSQCSLFFTDPSLILGASRAITCIIFIGIQPRPNADQMVSHIKNISSCFNGDDSKLKLSSDRSELLTEVMLSVYKYLQMYATGSPYASEQLRDVNCMLIGKCTS